MPLMMRKEKRMRNLPYEGGLHRALSKPSRMVSNLII